MNYSEELEVDDLNYTAYKINNEMKKVNEEVISILIKGAVFGLAGFATMCLTLWCKKSDIKNELYCFFNFQHTFSITSHLILTTCLYIYLQNEDFAADLYNDPLPIIIYESSTYFSLAIPLWTACVSLKMFADLFLFENGANIYSIKEVSKFAYVSTLIVQFYEEIVLLCLYNISTPSQDEDVSEMSVPATRLTSILLVLSIPIAMFFIILSNVIRRNDERRFMGIVYAIQMFILICSDLILVVFKVRNNKDLDVYVSAVFLSARVGFEVVWTLLMKSNLPVFKHLNYY